MTHTSKRPVANGTRYANGKRSANIFFDEETFLTLRTRAQCEGTSFSEQVRTLIEWGLESAR